MTNAPRPGWYPDPAGTADSYRWWDGKRWTDHLSGSPNAPTPSGTAVARDELEPVGSRRRRSGVRAAIALVVIVAMVASAGVGVGIWLWRDSPPNRAQAGAATTPRPRPASTTTTAAGPRGQLDESSRMATIGTASMQLPDAPYEVHADPVSVSGVFDVAFLAEAEVHRQYDGNDDWSAMVGLAAPSADLVDTADLEVAGKATLSKLAKRLYGDHPIEISRVRWDDQSVDGHPGLEFRARVRYAIDRLPSSYDTVRAVLVRLDDGTIVAAVSAVPNDADPSVGRLAEKALDSLTIS